MGLNEFLAIATYDKSKNPQSKGVYIVDPSLCASAFCVEDEKGNMVAKGSWDNQSGICYSEVVKKAFDWKAIDQQIQDAFKDYCCSEADAEITGTDMKVSDVLKLYSPDFSAHFQGFEDLTEKLGIDISDCRILLIGELATFYPALFMLKQRYSVFPIFDDDRFECYENTSEIVSAGNQIIERNRVKVIDGSIEWVIVKSNNDGKAKTSLVLAKDGTSVEDLANARFSDWAFACEGDMLEVLIGKHTEMVSVPNSVVPQGTGMIRLGLRYFEDKFFLRVEGENNFEDYCIDVRIKGE